MMQGDTAMEGGMDHSTMDHGTLEVGDTENVPSIDIAVHKDLKSGWNVEMQTENFRFAPEHASSEHVAGEGHAHVYVDDVKLNRVYSDWYHISHLESGEHEIRVTLNANSHDELTVGGKILEDTQKISVQ